MARLLLRLLLALALLGGAGLALYPLAERQLARSEAARLLRQAQQAAQGADGQQLACSSGWLGGQQAPLSALHSWGEIGGCGAGGGSSGAAAGGAKWIGRGATGGYVDLQLLATEAYANGNYYSTFNTRLGTGLLPKWVLGVNVPLLYKAGEVDVLGQSKTAQITGFGDLSLEVGRKLGITNASLLLLSVNLPLGAHDAVRQGVILPQHLQLGSGVVGASLQFEHTVDRDWGLMIFGGTAGYNGWENDLGDWRAPSATAYAYAGYVRGPLVPAAGLTLFGKYAHDRERGDPRPSDEDPLFMAIPSLSLEWSLDYLAFLLYASSSLSYTGFEGAAVTLGVSTSL